MSITVEARNSVDTPFASQATAVATARPVETSPAVVGESAALLSMIERAARDPSVDIDRMERLYEMHERTLKRNQEAEFNAAMSNAQSELLPVSRKCANEHTRSKYADLAAISQEAMPIIHKHGFGLSFSDEPSDLAGHMLIVCEVTHRAGFTKIYRSYVPTDGAGAKGGVNKTATHAYGSTKTYGRRYLTLDIFNISTKDDDGNASGGSQETITDEQQELLKSIVAKVADNPGPFLEFAKVSCFADIKVKDFGRLHALLLQRAKKVKK